MSNIKYGGAKIGFEIKGEGFPVIFIHGMLMDHKRDFLYTDELIKSGFKVIEIDLPGHGSSTYWTPRTSTLIRSIKALITKLKIKEYHCAGLSMGANLASELAIKDKRVKKIAMIVPVISKKNTSKFFAKMLWETISDGKISPRDFFRNTYKTNTSPKWPKEKIEDRIDEIFSQRWEAFLGGVIWNSQINVGKNISDLGKRALVISGKFDQLAPVAFAKKYATNLKIISSNHSDITKKHLGYKKKNLMVDFFSKD